MEEIEQESWTKRMTGLKLTFSIGCIALTGLGIIMALTNPGQKAYEQYASKALNVYLKENVCTQLPPEISGFLQSHCHSLVDIMSPQLSQVIANQTQRQNFILFSIYQTDLSIPSPSLDYQIKTLGVLQNFYIYEAEQF